MTGQGFAALVVGQRHGTLLAHGDIAAVGADQLPGEAAAVQENDALFAAFLNYYGQGFSPEDALERAQMFAAMKIRVSGAARGFSTEAEIEEALKNAKR